LIGFLGIAMQKAAARRALLFFGLKTTKPSRQPDLAHL